MVSRKGDEKKGNDHKGDINLFNPLHPSISMHILHTVLYTFPNVLARRICFTIMMFFSELLFPFSS